MTTSYLLRLVDGARAGGRIVGTAEVLETGETVVLRSAQDLLDLLVPAAFSPPSEEARKP